MNFNVTEGVKKNPTADTKQYCEDGTIGDYQKKLMSNITVKPFKFHLRCLTDKTGKQKYV